MTGSLLVLILLAARDRPKPDTPEDFARRAAIVDRVMAEPSPPDLRPRKPPADDVPADLPGPVEPEGPEQNRDEDPFEKELPRAVKVVKVLEARRAIAANPEPRRYLTLEPSTPPDEEERAEPAPPGGGGMEVRLIGVNHNPVLGRENFDRWIFGDDFGEARRRPYLEARLVEWVNNAAQMRQLTSPQQEKLRLAGAGDIKRYFDRVESERRAFDLVRGDLAAGRRALNDLKRYSVEFHAGPFGDDSLFAKTLRKLKYDEPGTAKPGR